jgi:hypothetical protein
MPRGAASHRNSKTVARLTRLSAAAGFLCLSARARTPYRHAHVLPGWHRAIAVLSHAASPCTSLSVRSMPCSVRTSSGCAFSASDSCVLVLQGHAQYFRRRQEGTKTTPIHLTSAHAMRIPSVLWLPGLASRGDEPVAPLYWAGDAKLPDRQATAALPERLRPYKRGTCLDHSLFKIRLRRLQGKSSAAHTGAGQMIEQ